MEERGAEKVSQFIMDIEEVSLYNSVLNWAIDFLGGLDVAFIAHGSVCYQNSCEHNHELLTREIHTNFFQCGEKTG